MTVDYTLNDYSLDYIQHFTIYVTWTQHEANIQHIVEDGVKSTGKVSAASLWLEKVKLELAADDAWRINMEHNCVYDQEPINSFSLFRFQTLKFFLVKQYHSIKEEKHDSTLQ